MTDKPKPMTEDELRSLIDGDIADSETQDGSQLSDSRRVAMRYYLGLPYGNEVEGFSQVRTTEVRDTIEATMPGLMKIFLGSDELGEFEATQPQDAKAARDATDYVNYVVTTDNAGWFILQDAFRDALMQKLGVVKVWWEERTESKRSAYRGMSDPEFFELAGNSDVDVISHTKNEPDADPAVVDPMSGQPMPAPPTTHDVEYRTRKKVGCIRLSGVPPENFMVGRRSKHDLDAAAFCGHREKYTLNALIGMGYDRDKVIAIGSDANADWNDEATTRSSLDSGEPQGARDGGSAADPLSREVWVVEAYRRVDFDGDGYAELRKVVMTGGTGGTILENVEIDECPLVAGTPTPIPHRLFGMSQADMAMDLQLTRSTVVRQVMDNMYRMNNARTEVPESAIGDNTIDDLLDNVAGGLVRTKGAGGLIPLTVNSIAPVAAPVIEMLETEVVKRTGVSTMGQAIDANTLLGGPATNANIVNNKSLERQELIARNLGESLVKGIMEKVLRLAIRHQQDPRAIPVRGEWASMSPPTWNDQMKFRLKVGLGTGNKDQQLGHLNVIAQKQEAILMKAGPNNPLVGYQEYSNTLRDLVRNAGFANPNEYFKDPTLPQPPQPPPPPDPHVVMAQQKQQADQQQDAADMQRQQQRDAAELQLKRETAAQELQIEREKMAMENQQARDRLTAEFALKRDQMTAEFALKREEMAMRIPNTTSEVASDVRFGGTVG